MNPAQDKALVIARPPRWLTLLRIVSAVFGAAVLVLTAAAMRWEMVAAVVGAFGPPWWVSLPILGSVMAAATTGIWWRAQSRTARRVVGAISAAGLLLPAATVLGQLSQYRIERVTFEGPEITIGALVYVPRSPPPYAAVVIVHGSAPFKAGFYDLWADRVARNGLLVIVPDKRGVGRTGGEFERENNGSLQNLSLLASDVVAAVRYAATRDDVRADRIGILGMSQAGWVGPIAALQTSEISFMAFITAPTVSGREESIWSDLRGDDLEEGSLSRSEAEQVLDTVTAGGVDARLRLTKLAIPGFWMFGSDDNSVPTRRSVMALDSMTASGRPFTHVTLPGTGHLLTQREPGSFLPSVAPASWPLLIDWLLAQTNR